LRNGISRSLSCPVSSLNYDGLSMADWLYKVGLGNDYAKWLAFGLTEVKLGSTKLYTAALVDKFIQVAFAPAEQYTPYVLDPLSVTLNDYKVNSLGYAYFEEWKPGGKQFEIQFERDFPWLHELLAGSTLSPRMPAINRWTKPVVVSTGLPNDLYPVGYKGNDDKVRVFRPPYHERYRDKEALDRRYEREQANLERRDQALERVEARENRSLARDERRLKQHKEAQRRAASKERRAEIAENKADVTAPVAEAAQEAARKQKQGTAKKRPRGFGYRRD
jgi:hypothetical protein